MGHKHNPADLYFLNHSGSVSWVGKPTPFVLSMVFIGFCEQKRGNFESFVCQLTPSSVSFLTFQAPVHFSMYTDFFVKGTFVFSCSLCLQLLPPLQTPFSTQKVPITGGGLPGEKFVVWAGKNSPKGRTAKHIPQQKTP